MTVLDESRRSLQASPPPSAREATALRVREILSSRSGVTEKLMMGNLAFLVNGTMCCTVGHDGMLIRVKKADREALLKKPTVTPMTMGARTMKGFVRIAPAAYRTRASLERWVERGCSAACTDD